MSDLDRRDDELTERLAVVAKGDVLSARRALYGFVALMVPLLVTLVVVVRTTLDTNEAVKDRTVLEQRNAELEGQHVVDEDLLTQSTDWILRLSEQLRAAGEPVPEIVIRPTTTTEPGG